MFFSVWVQETIRHVQLFKYTCMTGFLSGFWLLQTRTFMESSQTLLVFWLSVLLEDEPWTQLDLLKALVLHFPASSRPSALSNLLLHHTREPCGSVHFTGEEALRSAG